MTLQISEAVLLGHALADRAARDAGIRALLIKGPGLTVQGLRGEHESSDVDLLVDPGERDRFVEVMGGHGWVPGPVSTAPTILPKHSRTIRHQAWPIEMDVHDRFPGFLADPQDVFEVLWERRTTVPLAGVDVTTCDPVSHAAVVALHHLRDPARGSSGPALAALATDLRSVVGDDGLAELSALATRTRSDRTLAAFLELVGAPAPEPGAAPEGDVAEWELRTASTGSEPWLVELSRQPWRRRPAAIWHAVWLSDEEIDAFHTSPLDRGSRARVRLRRLRRGLRQLPAALRRLAGRRLGRGSRG